MHVEIRDEPLTMTLAGASAERVVGTHVLDNLRPLQDRLSSAINAGLVMFTGMQWLVYDGQGRMLLGVEALPGQAESAGLEEQVVHMPRHAVGAYAGAYDGLIGAVNAMRSAILEQKRRFTFPWAEMYTNWDGGPGRVDAELWHAVV